MGSEHDRQFAAAALPGQVDMFGEAATFVPASGTARAITVVRSESQEADATDETETREQETLWVWVRRSATTGIAAVAIGDALRLSGDDANTQWAFQGQRRNVAETHWELLFGRNRPRRYGPR